MDKKNTAVIRISDQEILIQRIKNPVLLAVFLKAQRQKECETDEQWGDGGHSDSWGDRSRAPFFF